MERKNLSVEMRQEYSDKIFELFINSDMFEQTDNFLIYVSTEHEVSTKRLMEYCWSIGKKVAVPKVLGIREMEFFRLGSFKELQKGYKGIMEPCGECKLNLENSVMIIPGIAFDHSGRRIGYGGGYYDTYMQKHPECKRVAFAFSVQMTENVPVESHDVNMDYIFTEKGFYKKC